MLRGSEWSWVDGMSLMACLLQSMNDPRERSTDLVCMLMGARGKEL